MPTFSTAGGEKFRELTASATGTVFQELKRLTQVSQESYRITGSLSPFLRPHQGKGIERWVKEPLSVPPFPLEGSAGLPRNGLVTCHHRNGPWSASGRWSEK